MKAILMILVLLAITACDQVIPLKWTAEDQIRIDHENRRWEMCMGMAERGDMKGWDTYCEWRGY